MVFESTVGREGCGAGLVEGCDGCAGFGAGRVDGAGGVDGRVEGPAGSTGFHLPLSLVSQPPGFPGFPVCPGLGRYTLPSGPA